MRSGWIEPRQGVKGTSFRVRFWVDGPTGELLAKSKSFGERQYGGKKGAESAAKLFLAKMLTSVVDGTYCAPAETTLKDLVDLWIQSKAGTISDSTVYTYRCALKHLSQDVSAIPIQRLKPMHLQALYGRLRADGVGPGIIGILHVVLRGALSQAVKWELLARNPAAAIARPERAQAAIAFWTTEQSARFLDLEGNDPRFGLIWRLAILTGMRRGELMALQWSDIDLARKTISIARTITKGPNGSEVMGVTTKTKNSSRTIPVPASCLEPLRLHRTRQLERRLASIDWSTADGDLVFTNDRGRFLGPGHVAGYFRQAVERSGLPAITMHGVRHSFATALMLSGVNPKVAAELLGDTVVTILRTYSHVTSSARENAVQAFDDRMAGLGDQVAGKHEATT